MLFSACLGGVYIVLQHGISSEWLSGRAQASLSSFLGPDLDAKIDQTSISLDSEGNIAIEADDVSILSSSTGRERASAASVKLGVGAWKLLFGEVVVSRVEVNDAVIDLTSPTDSGDPLAPFRNKNGQLSARTAVEWVFSRTDVAMKELSESARQDFSMNRVRVKTGSASNPDLITIESADLGRESGEAYALAGRIAWRGVTYSLTGALASADSFSLSVGEFPVLRPGREGATEPDGTLSEPLLTARMSLELQGLRQGSVKVLRARGVIPQFATNAGRNRLVRGSAILRVELRSDADKLEILPSSLRSGANFAEFSGAILPKAGPENPGYDFEIVSSRAALKPETSPEASVDVSAVVRGSIDTSSSVVNLTDIGLRTLSGELYGKGTLTFLGGSPRAVFGFRIPRMSVAHAKQIWPLNVAHGARKWVFEKVYGGFLTDSTIDVYLPEGRYGGPVQAPTLTPEELNASFNISGARFDIAGDLPPVRDAKGLVTVRGTNTEVQVESGTVYLDEGQSARVSEALIVIPYERGKPLMADVSATVSGSAAAVAAFAGRKPVDAMKNAPFALGDISGDASVTLKARFPLKAQTRAGDIDWSAKIDLKGVSIAKEFDGQTMSDANGSISADKSGFEMKAAAKLNGLPAKISLKQPFGDADAKRDLSVQLELNEKARATFAPGLNQYVKGPVYVDLSSVKGSDRQITADLTKATIALDFVGWSKGPGVSAAATFAMSTVAGKTRLTDFDLSGESFAIRGDISLDKSGLAEAALSSVRLVRGDNVSAKISRTKNGYSVKVAGESLDVRALVKRVTGSFDAAAKAVGAIGISVEADIGQVTGFNSETLTGLRMSYSGRGARVDRLQISATTNGGGGVEVANRQEGEQRVVTIQSGDAGSLLRFFDYYDKMRGGSINVNLASSGDGPLNGSVDARNFTLVDEPRMRSLVGGAPKGGGPSLTDAVKKDIDVSKVKFSRGYADIRKSAGFLALGNGILRSEMIGLAFQGTAYDRAGNINISGTFMPAYGLNRIFGEIPLLGGILGNGRDRGLIGITFKLSGNAKKPQLSVNPISVIAPGIFRQIFEFQ